MTRRPISELRAHADKVPGYGHLVAHEMVDEIEELRAENELLNRQLDELNDALCGLLHTGSELGDHTPESHLKLYYDRAALERRDGE